MLSLDEASILSVAHLPLVKLGAHLSLVKLGHMASSGMVMEVPLLARMVSSTEVSRPLAVYSTHSAVVIPA